jgi:hypothetical protein
VPAVASGLRRRQVAIDVRETGAGDMRLRIGGVTELVGLREIVADVDDDKRRILQVRGERIGVDQRRKR